MSDKSVSKWERGICLPDVSIYMELCSILRISINEFLAGEDIGTENVIEKSDSNLIQITKESKKKQKNLKTILAVVTVFAVIVSAILGTLFFHKLIHPKNYITAVDQTSTEMKTAELLSGTDGAYLFHYFTKDEFINTYNTFLQSFDFAGISKEKDLQGKRSFGTDKYIGTYKAEYDNITSEETIFGGTALNRKNGDHIRLKIKVEKQSGNINVIAKLGDNEKTLIDDTGEYEDNIYIEGVSYYLTIKLDNFKGNIDIISE